MDGFASVGADLRAGGVHPARKKVKAIDDDTMAQAKAVREDTSIAKADKRAKMMDIHKASQDKIRAVLTDDQKTKYDALQAQMKERREKRGGGDSAPPPAPPQ